MTSSSVERIGKVRGRHESLVVGRCMVLSVFSMRRSPEASDGKIESWRVELPLIIAVGRKIPNFERIALGMQDMLDGPVDIRSESSAALVVDASPVTYAGQDESMFDPADLVLIARQPCYRTDGPRHEQEAVCQAMRCASQDARKRRGDSSTR